MIQMLSYPFMQHALIAGTLIAVMSGTLGWFMVLRTQVFAGHTLSAMSFPGAAAALVIGIPLALGYYIVCICAAIAIGWRTPTRQLTGNLTSARIGTIQVVGFAAGFTLLGYSTHILGGLDQLLFGTFLGIDRTQLYVLFAMTCVVVIVTACIGRPLVFASLDPELAAAIGLPVRALDMGFLVLLGTVVAATAQITGALLVFALLVTPPAIAQRLTARPVRGMMLSAAIGVAIIWLSLICAYFSVYPLGFFTTTIGFAVYVVVVIRQRSASRARPVVA
jgi:zinc/manganese transport system permease protein